MRRYDPKKWFWIADDGRVFSSERQSSVPKTDAAYLEFLLGGPATRWPEDADGAQTSAALQDVLSPYGVWVDLVAYANAAQWRVATSGVVLQVGGQAVPFSTTVDAISLINSTVLDMQIDGGPENVNWQVGATDFITITKADFLIAARSAKAFVQGTFDKLPTIFAGIAAGTITTTAEVDAALAD